MNKRKVVFVIKAKTYWSCPMCHWRCNSRTGFKGHMKYQHKIGFNQVKLTV